MIFKAPSNPTHSKILWWHLAHSSRADEVTIPQMAPELVNSLAQRKKRQQGHRYTRAKTNSTPSLGTGQLPWGPAATPPGQVTGMGTCHQRQPLTSVVVQSIPEELG